MRILCEQLCSFVARLPLVANYQNLRIGIVRGGGGSGSLRIAQIVAHHIDRIGRRDRNRRVRRKRGDGREGSLAPLGIVRTPPVGVQMGERQRHRQTDRDHAH